MTVRKILLSIPILFSFEVFAEANSSPNTYEIINSTHLDYSCDKNIEVFNQLEDKAKEGDKEARAYISYYLFTNDCNIYSEDRVTDFKIDTNKWVINAFEEGATYLHYQIGMSLKYGSYGKLPAFLATKGLKDKAKYVDYLIIAAKNGDYHAQREYVEWLINQPGSMEEGYKLLLEYARLGNPIAMGDVAEIIHFKGKPYEGFAPDYKEAYILSRQASGAGYWKAKVLLAEFYTTGHRLERNYSYAIELADNPNYKFYKGTGDAVELWKLMDDCTDRATTEILGLKLLCTSRDEVRRKLQELSTPVIQEDSNNWADRYSSHSLLPGSAELIVWYTSDNMFAKAMYKIDKNKSKAILDALNDKYGQPQRKRSSKTTWRTNDKFEIVYEEFRDIDTLSFIHPLNDWNRQQINLMYKYQKEHAVAVAKEKERQTISNAL